MNPRLQEAKDRYLDEIYRQINENPEYFLDLDTPSERPRAAKKPYPTVFGRFAPQREPTEAERAFGAGFYDGVTFGLGDEAKAGWSSLGAAFDDRDMAAVYDAELERVRVEAAYLQERHPIAYGSGVVVGNLAQPANYVGVGWAARGAGLLGRMGRGAAVGGVNGGLQGFTRGEGGIEDRALAGGKGVLAGAASGALLGLPIHGYKTGREISFGDDFRIAPFGNRTGNIYGKWPHYHRRVIGPDGMSLENQGIGRHRPWQPNKSGRKEQWWERL